MPDLEDNGRRQAWLDSLDDEERLYALRLTDMSPTMAVQWVGVDVFRILRAQKAIKASATVNAISAAVGGGVVVGLLKAAELMGWS